MAMPTIMGNHAGPRTTGDKSVAGAPLFGPFIDIGNGVDRSWTTPVLLLGGLIQVAGLASAIVGFAWRDQRLIRADLVVAPVVTPDGGRGLAARVSF